MNFSSDKLIGSDRRKGNLSLEAIQTKEIGDTAESDPELI